MFVLTGGSGHIGSHIIKHILNEGYPVRILTRTPLAYENPNLFVELGDLNDEEFLRKHIKPRDLVFHVAGKVDIHNHDFKDFMISNVEITKKITDICQYVGARLIYFSTVDIIKRDKNNTIEEPVVFKEIKQNDYYGYTKLEATKYVKNAIQNGLSGVILYPSAVIGKSDPKKGEITRAIEMILKSKVLFTINGGYNFIDVEDVAKAAYQASILQQNDEFILSGFNLSITDLYRRIRRITKKKKLFIYLPTVIVKCFIPFQKKYTMKMVRVLKENHKFNNRKMKKHLLSQLKPMDLSLSEAIYDLKNKKR